METGLIGVSFVVRHLLPRCHLPRIQAWRWGAAAHVIFLQIVANGGERDDQARDQDTKKASDVGGNHREGNCAHGGEEGSPELPILVHGNGIVLARSVYRLVAYF